MPILDVLYNFVIEEMGVPNIKVHSDHWVEFKRIYDADGDGVLSLVEFIQYCRFQVVTVFFSNTERTQRDMAVDAAELRDLRRRLPWSLKVPACVRPLVGAESINMEALTKGVLPNLGENNEIGPIIVPPPLDFPQLPLSAAFVLIVGIAKQAAAVLFDPLNNDLDGLRSTVPYKHTVGALVVLAICCLGMLRLVKVMVTKLTPDTGDNFHHASEEEDDDDNGAAVSLAVYPDPPPALLTHRRSFVQRMSYGFKRTKASLMHAIGAPGRAMKPFRELDNMDKIRYVTNPFNPFARSTFTFPRPVSYRRRR